MTETAREGLVSCIARWLPVLDEAELRAVEGFVLELVIAKREEQIDLSARGAAAKPPAVPHGLAAPRADAFTGNQLEHPLKANGPHITTANVAGKTCGAHLSAVETALAELRDAEPLYPCERCGFKRTRAQGGTVFTVCDECWDALVVDDPDATSPRQRFDTSDTGDGE